MDYEEYERLCEVRREENESYLNIFEESLMEAGLSDKTINSHLRNVHFYINEYLLREDAEPMMEGCYKVSDFLGYFFIRKCMWSTPVSIKSNAVSLKKFYKCMKDHGHIDAIDYETLTTTIRDEMEIWLEDCEAYNDPDAEDPFAPFW